MQRQATVIDKDRNLECKFCGSKPLVRDRTREEPDKPIKKFKFFRCGRCGLTSVFTVERPYAPVVMR